ncbi:hypothetical protein VMCG_01918 [Cytospora schulzeri]|uniref:Uncharacterized protein n=1 Tax=Cytospora schulzeri TaxID=448051 RepID=A0A423X3S9_9PEZI|nr:hypothetical protein VMCG_01918 [Valsa malicola]
MSTQQHSFQSPSNRASPKTQFWTSPEAPDKPEIPYIPGFTVLIHRHVVPPSHVSDDYTETVPQSRAGVDNTPLDTSSPTQPEIARLTITAPISIGAERGSQVVACRITPQGKSKDEALKAFNAAAKIYDPLYYGFKRLNGHYQGDCKYEHYRTEAAAYEHLQKAGQTGSFAPEYYGCWTFDLHNEIDGDSCSRPVRLILMEYLIGIDICSTRVEKTPERQIGTNSFYYPEEYRLEVLARALEGYARQVSIGVDQRDFAGSNVMLVAADSPTGIPEIVAGLAMPRIVLVDYNQAYLDCESEGSATSLSVNPALVAWNERLWENFDGWVPLDWEDDYLQHEWLLKRFCRDGQRELYLPLPDYLIRELESHVRMGSGLDGPNGPPGASQGIKSEQPDHNPEPTFSASMNNSGNAKSPGSVDGPSNSNDDSARSIQSSFDPNIPLTEVTEPPRVTYKPEDPSSRFVHFGAIDKALEGIPMPSSTEELFRLLHASVNANAPACAESTGHSRQAS